MKILYNSQIQLVGAGSSRGRLEITTEQLSELAWIKYNTKGMPKGEPKRFSAQEIVDSLGIKSRPYAIGDQNETTMFNEALDNALGKVKEYGFDEIKGNIIALFAGSTTDIRNMPNFLENICEHAGLNINHKREFVYEACASFNSGVNKLSTYIEENNLEGYAIVGVAERLHPLWKKDNFDLMLFGDVAGVAIFKVAPYKNLPALERGIVGEVSLHFPDVEGHIVRRDDGLLYMNGREVLKMAPEAMIDDCERSIKMAALKFGDINKFIFHPGSQHVYNVIVKQLKRRINRLENVDIDLTSGVPCILEDSGNNGAATTIHTLDREIRTGKIRKGDRVYMGSLGMGFYRAGFIINRFSFISQKV